MGASGSKLKKKNRSQSIAWSFRFSSLGSLSRRKMTSGGPHLEISQWLNILELGKYQKLFDKHQGVETILDYTEADLKHLGVKNATHRARMVASLVALSAKYNEKPEEKQKPKVKDKSFRHSVAVDTNRRLNRDDSILGGFAFTNLSPMVGYCLAKAEKRAEKRDLVGNYKQSFSSAPSA